MSQTIMSNNGPTSAVQRGPLTAERRKTVASETISPEALVARHIDAARRQLADAREGLKAARRRVVQLEDALCNWERFAEELRRDRGNGSGRPSA